MSALLVLAFTTALAMAVLLMPMVMRLATRLGAVSRPGGRHVHGPVTPLLGGFAFAFFAGAVVAFPSVIEHASARIPDAKLLVGLAAGTIGMVVLGFVDDTRGVRAVNTKTMLLPTHPAHPARNQPADDAPHERTARRPTPHRRCRPPRRGSCDGHGRRRPLTLQLLCSEPRMVPCAG